VPGFSERALSSARRSAGTARARKIGTLSAPYTRPATQAHRVRRNRKNIFLVTLENVMALSLPTTVGVFVTGIQLLLVPSRMSVDWSSKSGNP